LGSFLILSLYIVTLILTIFLIAIVTTGSARGEVIIWDDPYAVPTQIHDDFNVPAIFPENSFYDNEVVVSVNVNANVIGGYVYFTTPGDADIRRNKVGVSNYFQPNGYVYGGQAHANRIESNMLVNENQITVSNSLACLVAGGWSQVAANLPLVSGRFSIEASGNKAIVYNSTITRILVGGLAHLNYRDGDSVANDNFVYLENSDSQHVRGGAAYSYWDDYGSATANGNEVYIKNSNVVDYVYAGEALAWASSQTINNVLTLDGQVFVGGDVYGGRRDEFSVATDFSDHFTGNTLNIVNPPTSGIDIQGNLGNFETYNFYFSSATPSGSVGVTVGGKLTLNDKIDRGSSVTPVSLLYDGLPEAKEMDLVLFDSPNEDIDYAYFTPPADSTESFGALYDYDVKYVQDPRRFLATVGNFRLTQATEILPDGPSAGLDLVNGGGDLTAGIGGEPIDGFGPGDGYGDGPGGGYGDGYGDGPGGGYGDGYDDDYWNDDGYDPRDGYGSDDRGDPFDRDGRGGDVNPLERENRDEELSFDKPYSEKRQEVKEDGKTGRRNDGGRNKNGENKDKNRRRQQEAKARAKRVDPCPRAFFKAKGGQQKRGDGQDLTLNGYSVLVGADCGRYLDSGLLTFGLAFEGGKGSYDASRRLPGGIVRGVGDLDYVGGAFLGRFDFRPSKIGRFYLESSVRLGRLKSDLKTRNFAGALGREISYEANNSYAGFHFGLGDYIPITSSSYLNLYSQYFWVKLKGGGIRLNTGDVMEVKDSDSHRIRAGAQFHQALGGHWRAFVGAAYERETDGQTKATIQGHKIPTVSKKGDSGLYELGLAYNSQSAKPLSFSLALQANSGQRRGLAGVAQLGVVF
jgi:outer membrane autotransporter protein